MRYSLTAGLFFVAIAAGAGSFVFTAPEGEVQPVLNDRCKQFMALPPDKLDSTLLNRDYYEEFRKIGSRPCRIRFAWEYRPDADEKPPRGFTVTLRKADTGLIVYKAETDKPEIKLDNFEIAADYVFRAAVCNSKGKELFGADRPFKTEDLPPRVVNVESVANFRDLGGWIGEGGKRVKQGLVYRSQGLNNNADWFVYDKKHHKHRKPDKKDWHVAKTRGTPESRRQCLAAFGFKTEIDLRGSATETWGMTGSPLGSSVDWRLVVSSAYGAMDKPEARVSFARDFRTFLNRDNYPIVFHCIGGADRTGTLAYILNGLLGVSEADLDRDYHFTAACMAYPWPMVATNGCCRMDGFKKVLAQYPGTTINERIRGYVLACGIRESEIAMFKSIMFGEDVCPKRDAYVTFFNAPSSERRALMRDGKFREELHACKGKWAGVGVGVPRWYPEAPNLRDLGGWKAMNGSRIRFGRLFRCASLDKPKDRTAIVKRLGVKTDLDLRKPHEAKPTADLPAITVVANAYDGTVKDPKWLRQAFDVMLDETKYPIAFHCAAGADRTGTLAVAIELLLGVDEDDVAKDWQLTAVNNLNPLFESIRYDRLMQALSQLKGDTWQAKVEEWVRSAGVTDAEIAKFRQMMLDEPKLAFGLVSDTHICSPLAVEHGKGVRNSDDTFRYAMRWMASEGVDAVVNAGDLTEIGTVEEAELYRKLFEREFEDGCCRDLKRKVTHFSVWGNHDCHDASYMSREGDWKFTNELVNIRANYEKLAPEFTGVPLGDGAFTREIKGTWFAGVNWKNPVDGEAAIDRAAEAAGPSNICFFIKHAPSLTPGEKAALGRHPNCVRFTGHSHVPFTATNALSVVNGSVWSVSGSTSGCKGGGAQAAIVRVWDWGITIDKREVKRGDRLGPETVLVFADGGFKKAE